MSEIQKLYKQLEEIDKQIETIGLEWFPKNITKAYEELETEKDRLIAEIQMLEYEQSEIDY